MKGLNVLLTVLGCLALTAAAEGRSCETPPTSGDPGDAGAGLTVSVQSLNTNLWETTFDFPVGAACHVWSERAVPDLNNPEVHLKFYAADQSAFADGTLRMTVYGPADREDLVAGQCADREDGRVEYVTTTHACRSHGGTLQKVVDVRGMGKK
ncbi:MAG: hypothetical protein AAGD06_08680 [Acidobacteriota bacterium]